MNDLAAVAYFLAAGWLALWPLRGRLGAWAYHAAALPVGLLAAPLSAAFTTTVHRPLDFVSAAVGAAMLVAGVWVISWFVLAREHFALRPAEAPGFAGMSFAIATGAFAVVGGVLGVARFTIANADSYVSYWPLGVELSRTGALNERVFASRAQLLPSISAIHVTFGSDWGYVVYPLIAGVVLVWLGMTLWNWPLATADRRIKVLVAACAVGFLLLEPSFLFNAVFVHSHMLSACFFLMAITSLIVASRSADEEGPDPAWLVIAGAFTAGFALTRTDGLAYEFVPVACAIAALTMREVRARRVAAYFAPLMFVVYVVFAAGFFGLGLWQDDKLSGKPALMILGVLALSALGPWIVRELDRRLPWRVAGERFASVLVSAAALLMLAVFVLKWDSARLALANTRINLLQGMGGYFYLWWAVLALIVLSLFTRDALRMRSWTRPAFLSIALFFVIAGLVHGTAHAGRIGPGDSLNRIVFHTVPLIVWYVAAVVARILTAPGDLAEKPA